MTVINLTVTTESDDVFPMQLDSNDPVEQLRAYVEAVTGLKAGDQMLVLDGKPLPEAGTLASAGIKDRDLLFVMPKGRQQAAANAVALQPDGSAVDPEAFMRYIRSDQRTLRELQQGNKRLADALLANDVAAFQNELRAVKRMANADPLDPEYQQRMYEQIQEQNIDENYMNAMENTPEVFASVDMLYVDMAVNGEPVKAFIDSGAQTTIMTQTCAEKCSIMRLVDKRFHGVAVGVGSSRIVGRIHTCAVRVGDQYIASSITVLEQKDGPQFIFGLDNLKRHHCCINLRQGVLEVGSCGVVMPFLAEHQIPKDFNTERQRPDGKADEMDAAGSKPGAVQGDLSAVRRTNSSDAPGSTSMTLDTPTAATAGPSTAPPAGGAAAPSASSHLNALAKQLQEITGKELSVCMEALRSANGNIDLAAAQLMGF